MNKSAKVETKNFFPPVVSVLGHVDHGKTTLLDAIRKTSVAQRESGGITQKIGASQIEIMHDGQKRRITFIDTPGHEAFTKMRSRGAQAADIGLLIVSAVDGVMPQTRESIQLLKDAGIPFIVVLTKADMEGKNPEKVKQQLLKENVLIEGYGGDIPVIEVSAKAGTNIHELLDLILLVYELHPELSEKRSVEAPLKSIVIESRLDKKAGPRATIVIKNGTVNVREELVSETIGAKVRTIIDDKGNNLESASVGDAIEILGFEKVPNVGSVVAKKSELSLGKRSQMEIQSQDQEMALLDREKIEQAVLTVILRADTLGSLEAIVSSLPSEIVVISKKTGDVTPADVLFAKSTGAIVIGFNVKIGNDIFNLARTEKVLVKNYTIIYELLDELSEAMEGKILSMQEEIYGKAKVLASFPFEKTQVLGVSVMEGRIAKGDKVRITRGEEIVGESHISSVRQGKNPISKVEKGQEAGVILSPFVDFTIGDVLICHN